MKSEHDEHHRSDHASDGQGSPHDEHTTHVAAAAEAGDEALDDWWPPVSSVEGRFSPPGGHRARRRRARYRAPEPAREAADDGDSTKERLLNVDAL